MGDPAYEAPMPAASYSNAKLFKVPRTKNYAHDVKAMVSADPHAGLMCICHPNNPTGTTTTREDIEHALANKPQGSILLVDNQSDRAEQTRRQGLQVLHVLRCEAFPIPVVQ